MTTGQKRPLNALQAVLDRQAAPPASPAPRPAHSRPSRSGKHLIGGHFPPDVAKHIKILAAEEGTSVQALLEEAIDLLFLKKGKGACIRVAARPGAQARRRDRA
jgi:hypothetical protein